MKVKISNLARLIELQFLPHSNEAFILFKQIPQEHNLLTLKMTCAALNYKKEGSHLK